jgi:hypothetical protein
MITIEITPLWCNDESLSQAFKSNPTTTQDFVKTWSTISKIVLGSGKYTKRTGKIQDVNRRVVLDEDMVTSITPFVDAGMIRYVDAETISELSDKHFEQFWILYPARLSGSHEVKVGKKEARQAFSNEITTLKDFEALLRATKNYETITDKKFICDASRFIRNKWRDYVDITKVHKQKTKDILDQKGYNALFGQ